MKLITLYEMTQEEYGEADFDLLRERMLRYQYVRDGKLRRGAFRFDGVAAIQIRSNRYLEEWHNETFYSLVEVLDSPWKAYVLGLVHKDSMLHGREKHHYAILDDDYSYEFIADSWQLLPEKEGWAEKSSDW